MYVVATLYSFLPPKMKALLDAKFRKRNKGFRDPEFSIENKRNQRVCTDLKFDRK